MHLHRMNFFRLLLFALPFLTAVSMHAQHAKTVPGEVLFQLKSGVRAEQVEHLFHQEAGILPSFQVIRCVSEPMRIWLGSFDPSQTTSGEVIRLLESTSGISVAQANHVVESRETLPDDPFFSNQWYHAQLNDKDIDSDLAWDITTGGQTLFGEDIVVCVVEPQGAKWNHPDILPNHWVNESEIPDNGLDDDNNGYVDDYDGYNVTNGSDNISEGNHGTQVSSMIGAKGNNNAGIAGVNWDVKIMQVQLGSVSEANVISAYTYPLVMRKLYNQTGGDKGALVVATNSSWGTDNGQPSNAPLWCAMYDSLGYYGVLSCGATANNNVNIDVVGDLPTACPSEFLLSVTATNSDDVRTFSGYGQTTIDLGAPGANVYLAGNSTYSNTSGTSFASPCVAGAIALIYSAPCASLAATTQAFPSLAAEMVRDYIFDGIDTVSNLSSETVTGGRLNVRNSLDLVLADCDANLCTPPFALSSASQVDPLDVLVSWSAIPGVQSFSARFREVAGAIWTEITDLSSPTADLSNLLSCTLYEVQAQAFCEFGESDWSISHVFTSAGCCELPEAASLSSSTGTTLTVSWEPVFGAVSYGIVLTGGGLDLEIPEVAGTSFTFPSVPPCETYFISITTNCENSNPNASLDITVHSGGCADCTQLTFCDVIGDASSEWIEQVVVNDLTNATESNGGYADFTDLTTTLIGGQTYPISCTPGYSGFSYTQYFKVWADWNSDGEFQTNEVIFDPGNTTTTTVSGEFTVPLTVTPGHVRMRVSMSYMGNFGGGAMPVTCGSMEHGEAEDYCLIVDQEVQVNELSMDRLLIYPNPSSGDFFLSAPVDGEFRVFDMSGRQLLQQRFAKNSQSKIAGLSSGIYLISYVTESGISGQSRVVVQ